MTSDEDLVIPDEQWVAHVCVASGLAHLDRPFDYLVPADLVEQVSVGVRVRVRLAGRLCDAIVLAVDHDDKAGLLAVEEFLDHHTRTGLTEGVAGEHVAHGVAFFVAACRSGYRPGTN